MKIGKGKPPSFYKTRLKAFIKYLKQFENKEITELLNEEELLDNGFILRFASIEKSFFARDITPILDWILRLYKISNVVYDNMQKIGLIILHDDSISNKDFLAYLYKKEIALILGGVLNEFHESCYQEALQKKSLRDLKKVFNFRYTTETFKRKVAVSILEQLINSKYPKKKLVNEWTFQTKSTNKKIEYLNSLETDTSISQEEYLDLFKLYAKLDSSSKVKYYIYNVLYEKGVLHENVELLKIAVADTITSTHLAKYFRLLFDTAKENNDTEVIKWIYSLYPLKSKYRGIKCMGRKEVANFLNLPLYATK